MKKLEDLGIGDRVYQYYEYQHDKGVMWRVKKRTPKYIYAGPGKETWHLKFDLTGMATSRPSTFSRLGWHYIEVETKYNRKILSDRKAKRKAKRELSDIFSSMGTIEIDKIPADIWQEILSELKIIMYNYGIGRDNEKKK